MKERFLRADGNYDADEVSLATGLSMSYVDPETGEVVEDHGFAQQEFALECDINEIVRRFGLTGEMPEVWNAPQSGDFVNAQSFEESMNAVVAAKQSFMELPAELRLRFNNDPQRLIDFLENGENRDEAVKLGLLKPKAEPVRDVVTAIDEMAAKLPSIPKPDTNAATK